MQRFLRFFRARLGVPLLYVLIAACVLGANPFRGETVGPFDLLASYSGWNPDGREIEVRNRERSDILDFFLPTWLEARSQIHEGQLPQWNALRAGGTPGLFDPINAELTLPFAIFAVVPDPATGFYLAILSCLVVSGLGMHYLVRRYCGSVASLFAGISYMMCGFITAWLFWPHTNSAMWIPWLLLAVDVYLARGRFTAMAPMALATAFMFLGGFPFVVAMGLGAAIVWGIFKTLEIQPRDLFPNVTGIGIGIGLGLMLAAVPLFTLIDTIKLTDISYRSFGTPYNLSEHARLLVAPWAQRDAHVESNMYVGMIALLAALLGAATLMFRNVRTHVLAWAGLFFSVTGFVLVFGLLPKEIGGHLPVLSYNNWNRGILLLDIGLILLAAAGMDWMQARIRPVLAGGVLAVALVLVQAVDLGSQFRRFNGPVASDQFFPVSSELAMLKSSIRPFQYVGQDSSAFMISGTLGAVGLGEWHAHSLRSPAMRQFLKAMAPDSMTTATATAIALDKYRWSNMLLDAAGLCYAVSGDTRVRWPELVKAGGNERVALTPINNQLIRQPVTITSSAEVPAVAVRLANYAQTGLDGLVRLRLVSSSAAQGNGSPALPGWSSLSASGVRNNDFAVFVFPKPLLLMPGDYEIQLVYEPGPKQMNLTAWTMKDEQQKFHRDAEIFPGAIEYVVYRSGGNELRQLARGPKIAVLENPDCAKGAYFALGTGLTPPNQTPAQVELSEYQPDHFIVDVKAPEKGYLVIPMQYRNGWRAEVNGRSTAVELVAGVMPAIAVGAGRSTVTMAYRPPRLHLGIAISVLTVLVLLAGSWFSRRTRPGDGPGGHDLSGSHV